MWVLCVTHRSIHHGGPATLVEPTLLLLSLPQVLNILAGSMQEKGRLGMPPGVALIPTLSPIPQPLQLQGASPAAGGAMPPPGPAGGGRPHLPFPADSGGLGGGGAWETQQQPTLPVRGGPGTALAKALAATGQAVAPGAPL